MTRSVWDRGSCHVGNCYIDSDWGRAVVLWTTVCGFCVEDRRGEGRVSGGVVS